jgi:hypothetical protein
VPSNGSTAKVDCAVEVDPGLSVLWSVSAPTCSWQQSVLLITMTTRTLFAKLTTLQSVAKPSFFTLLIADVRFPLLRTTVGAANHSCQKLQMYSDGFRVNSC